MPRTSAQSRRIAISSYKREAAYGTAPTVNSTNYSELDEFTSAPAAFSDDAASNVDTIIGRALPTKHEITVPKVELPYTEPRARPNSIASLLALSLGAPTASTQDGALVAYRHRFILPTPGTDALSGAAVELAGDQRLYPGIVAKSFSMEGASKGYLSCQGSLMGSGSRAANADAFPSKIVEPWMNMGHMSAWIEVGATRSIAATPTQGAQNISSGAGIALKDRIAKMSFGLDETVMLDWGIGGGGAGLAQQAFYGAQPKVKLSFTLAYKDVTEINYYFNQNDLALEFDLKHPSLIAVGGAFYWGIHLVIPHCRFKPMGRTGNVGEFLGQDIEVEVMDDETNPPIILHIYNSKSVYLAA